MGVSKGGSYLSDIFMARLEVLLRILIEKLSESELDEDSYRVSQQYKF